jgi:UDP-N-acetyl-D-galactosamine dehydrogenase
MNKNSQKIAILGLGYVGLPLSVAFAKKYTVIGYDLDINRVEELQIGCDKTQEVEYDELNSVLVKEISDIHGLYITHNEIDLKKCNIFIATVPTPIDKFNQPMLTPLIEVSKTIAENLKVGDIVIYESTVYPGVTEEELVPILEKHSGLRFNIDFYCGYSPERINPGDKLRSVTNILKVTSGSNPEIAEVIDNLYSSVILAGTYKAPSIRVAEAAKVIENAQRDINIAFVNELAKIFSLLGIDTHEVLSAARTKWNFLDFRPGLVGGHCIGVDPYYLARKAQEVGYNPEIILAGRRVNDGMGSHIANEVLRLMIRKEIVLKYSSVLILGITFKENCPDIRNSRVIDIYSTLKGFGLVVDIFDPIANANEVKREYGLELIDLDQLSSNYDAVILAVAHSEFKVFKFENIMKERSVIYDVKGLFPRSKVDARL